MTPFPTTTPIIIMVATKRSEMIVTPLATTTPIIITVVTKKSEMTMTSSATTTTATTEDLPTLMHRRYHTVKGMTITTTTTNNSNSNSITLKTATTASGPRGIGHIFIMVAVDEMINITTSIIHRQEATAWRCNHAVTTTENTRPNGGETLRLLRHRRAMTLTTTTTGVVGCWMRISAGQVRRIIYEPTG